MVDVLISSLYHTRSLISKYLEESSKPLGGVYVCLFRGRPRSDLTVNALGVHKPSL